MDSDDTPIIVNEDALTEAFIPTRLLHRESHIRELERGIEAGPGTKRKPAVSALPSLKAAWFFGFPDWDCFGTVLSDDL